ncbi:ion channel [Natronolimnohabitans innermongolicus]|uniref:TrkA-N domain-containing protein n=1 Tax=Natronolimnohabitans innermongolicus JCM 12255 TaxID=1227499 RepID=L9WR24_9EURY|nr:ion channel [Natronolimnohabitans innermongolicus]ELY51646.1 TrkA-N domain-containing protein [Natronolimnohabitans innermongolicus JCM 12255]
MLDWLQPRHHGRRIAVWVVAAIGLVSIATGVVAILTDPAIDADGVLGIVQSVAEFSGTVVGFALLVTAWGMQRGYRIAYVAAVGFVCLSAAHGIVQFRTLSVPLILLSVGGLVVLVTTSDRFRRSTAFDATQIGALLAIVGVFCYGTAGTFALRAQFDGVETVVDAAYFTVVTASTVGYGDVHAATDTARLFAISLVALGPTTVAAAVGSLVRPAIERYLERTGRRATTARDSEVDSSAETDAGSGPHVVVLGVGAGVASIVESLARRASVVAVTSDGATSSLPDGADEVVGDPTATRTLERAGVTSCDAVLVGPDAGDVEAAVAAARSLTDARIVAVAAGDSSGAFERNGADAVVDPEAVVAEVTTDALLDPDGFAAQSSPADVFRRG